jgi:kynureninase
MIDARARDAADPLAPLREAFDLPPGKTYLDGNSLGALSHRVRERVSSVVSAQWGEDLIESWNRHDWISLPQTVGEQIAPLIGAGPGQVVCSDSISINLFKLLATALALRPGRRVILSEQGNFPTDLYMAEGLAGLLGAERCELRLASAGDLGQALDEEVAVLLLTQVNFRDGRLHDMAGLTRAAQRAGALVLWDLAHSAGVIPMQLDRWQVDMAVGCGYKFLNGGPGAPAFLYLAERHQGRVQQPLCGWMGHRRVFDFSATYEPAEDIRAMLSGTPGILGMAALGAALELFEGTAISALREKSIALTEFCIQLTELSPELGSFRLLSPRAPEQRGSQVSLAHPQAFPISQALIADGIVVDFRAPDILRMGFAPLYNSFADVERAIEALAAIMREQRYLQPRFQHRGLVT